jgi:quercetin dioxygenase-like cupin family protein
MSRNVVVVDGAQIPSLQVFGEEITILANHGQTGSYEVYVHDAPQGVGPPHHSHPWDGAFYVIHGAVDFVCGDVAKTVSAGGFVHVPAGTVHTFRYASATARILGITSGNGAATMFAAIDSECSAAPDLNKAVAVLKRHNVDVVLQPD